MSIATQTGKHTFLPPINIYTDTQNVIPAWTAGIQKPRMASSNHILVTWIPADHAGMTSYFYGYELVIGDKTEAHRNEPGVSGVKQRE